MPANPSLRKLSARQGKTVLKMKKGRRREGWRDGGMDGRREGGRREKKEKNLIQVGSKELQRLHGKAGAERRDRHRVS